VVTGNPSTGACLFQGNCYWPSGGTLNVAGHSSLAAWRAATGQERLAAADCGMMANPQLVDAGSGAALTDPSLLNTLVAYQLQQGSPCIDSGLDLQALFSLAPGPRDFYGNAVPLGDAMDIGAYETENATGLGARTLVHYGRRGRTPYLFRLNGRRAVEPPSSRAATVMVGPAGMRLCGVSRTRK
jgi:hypothetical protein